MISGYSFYLGELLLPVTPGALKWKIKNQNRTLKLINEGEINLVKPAGLTGLSFSALLPRTSTPFAQYADGVFRPASYYIEELDRLKTQGKAFYFRVLRPIVWDRDMLYRAQGLTRGASSSGGEESFQSLEHTELLVTLESYSLLENAVRYGADIGVEIELLQYRSYGTKILTLDTQTQEATETAERSTETKETPRSYTVAAGDYMWAIAQKCLGDGARWPEIYALNKDTMEAWAVKNGEADSHGGTYVYVGETLLLPEE